MVAGRATPSQYVVPQRVIDRIFDRVDVRGPEECWPWLLSLKPEGYGQVGWTVDSRRTAMTLAHRVAWMATFGPIPDGDTIDHVCRNRVCCNPSHLRLMSNVANATMNGNWLKTHCKRGHAFTPENTRTNARGHRWCRTCARLYRGGQL